MRKTLLLSPLFLLTIAATSLPAATSSPGFVALPRSEGGIVLDDLRWSDAAGGILVPGGKTDSLFVIDAAQAKVKSMIIGMADQYPVVAGGAVSADSDDYYLYAAVRGSRLLRTIDPVLAKIVATVHLANEPSLVRFTPFGNEIWVAEAEAGVIEVFAPHRADRRTLQLVGDVKVPSGLTALVLDRTRHLTWANVSNGEIVAIDQRNRILSATWKNGCRESSGLAMDEESGFLFAGCREGKLFAIDANGKGKRLSTLDLGAGVAAIEWEPTLRQLYVVSTTAETLSIVGVSKEGVLTIQQTVPIVPGVTTVASDRHGNMLVGDGKNGRTMIIKPPKK